MATEMQKAYVKSHIKTCQDNTNMLSSTFTSK